MRRESEMEEEKGERGEGGREREGGEMWIYEKRKRDG